MKQLILVSCSLALLAAVGCGSQSPYPRPDEKAVMALRGTTNAAAATADGAATPAAVVGEGWGSLKGVFVFEGAPPSLPNLSTGGKDGQVCDAHPIPDESLVVDPSTKGIAHIAVYARKVSRVHESLADPPSDPLLFDQKECVFLSHVLPVRVGQPMIVKNSDPIGHNTNITAPGDSKGTGNVLLAGGSEARWEFARPQNEPVAVACNIHPWMKAYVLPRKDPYFAVTGKDGSFQIENLPAGEELEFQVWQERTPKGFAAKPEWKQGRFKVKIPKDDVLDLGTIAVPASAFQ